MTTDGLSVVPREVIDASERRARRDRLAATWEQVPRGFHRFPAAAEFEAACSTWCPGRSLVLLGLTGTGKSAAVARLVARLCRDGRDNGGMALELATSLLWVRASDLAAAGASGVDDHAQRLIHRAQHCRLLVLDDVSEHSKTLWRVLERRYDRRRPTIATSGHVDPRDFAAALGGDAPFRWLLEAGTAGAARERVHVHRCPSSTCAAHRRPSNVFPTKGEQQ